VVVWHSASLVQSICSFFTWLPKARYAHMLAILLHCTSFFDCVVDEPWLQFAGIITDLHCDCNLVTFSDLAKYSVTQSVMQSLCGLAVTFVTLVTLILSD